MIIGTDKERKIDGEGRVTEWRVGATPGAVEELVGLGHGYVVESGAGEAAGFSDENYAAAGARITATQEEVYARAELIYKVKEPQAAEWDLLRPGQILFAYVQSVGHPEMLGKLLEHEVTAVAYEDVVTSDGRRPMLEPMSIIAALIAQQKGYRYLLADEGGVGVLSGHMTGVEPAKVCVVGTGSAGEAATRVARAMGSRVVALYGGNLERARRIELDHPGVVCLRSTPDNVLRALDGAHVLTNCLRWPLERRDEVLIRAEMLDLLDEHAVVVDVAAALLGGLETTRGVHTSHFEPLVEIAGKRHYAVPNVPSIAARSASQALANATLAWARRLAAGWDWRQAPDGDPLRRGLTCAGGRVVEPEIRAWYESVTR